MYVSLEDIEVEVPVTSDNCAEIRVEVEGTRAYFEGYVVKEIDIDDVAIEAEELRGVTLGDILYLCREHLDESDHEELTDELGITPEPPPPTSILAWVKAGADAGYTPQDMLRSIAQAMDTIFATDQNR